MNSHPLQFIRNNYPKIISSVSFLVLLFIYALAFANPPGSPYTGGATLDPTCAPGDVNCFVQVSQWTTNGSDIYYNSGNVGIGTNTPDGMLSIINSGTPTTFLTIGNSLSGRYVVVDDHVLRFGDVDGGTGALFTIDHPANKFTFTNGNVGIGTTSPSDKLEVAGNINLTNDGTSRSIRSVRTSIGDGSSLSISAGNGVSAMLAASGGNLNLLGGNGGGGSSFGGDVFINGGSGQSSGDVLIATTNGKVGVGTGMLNPNYTLDVVGSADTTARFVGLSGGGLIFGSFPSSTTFGAIWSSNVSPTNVNYILASNGSSTLLNTTNTIDFTVNSASVASFSSGGSLRVNNLGAGSTRCVQASSTGVLSVAGTACASAGTAMSSITAATTSNSISNSAYAQTWNWDTLSASGGTALTIKANASILGTLVGRTLLNISDVDGLNQSGSVVGISSSITSSSFSVSFGTTGYNYAGKFSSTGVNGVEILNNIGIYATASGGTNNYAGIFDQGNVGIGQITPGFKLHVGSSSVTDGTVLIRLQDTNSTCDFNANSGAPTCGSDMTLKKDVSSLNTTDLLNKISLLNPVSYHWLTEDSSSPLQYGFIAQEVAEQFPDLVSDHTWIDGTQKKFLNTLGLMPYVVASIKELNINIKGLSSLDTANSNSLGTLVKNFLADMSNTISDLYATVIHSDKVETKNLCVGNVCVTEQQFLQIVNSSNANNNSLGDSGQGSSNSPTSPTCTLPEVINADGTACELPASNVTTPDPASQPTTDNSTGGDNNTNTQ